MTTTDATPPALHPLLRAAGAACFTLLLAACHSPATAQSTAQQAKAATTHGQALYVANDYEAQGVFTKLVEGPAVGPDGALYLVGLGDPRNIARIPPQGGKPEVFVTLPAGSAGNGIRFDGHGHMLVADYTGHNIFRIDMATRKMQLFAHLAGAHQPNDIALAPDGTLYASDPDWKHGTGQLWRIDRNGKATVLETGMGTTNGIAVSPDGKHLYVDESKQLKLWVYDIQPEGSLTNKHLLHQFTGDGMDGMRCDQHGNIYLARYGAGVVAILSPEGKLLRKVQLKGKDPTNVAFGGADGRTVYVTIQDRGAVESFRSKIPGRFLAASRQSATSENFVVSRKQFDAMFPHSDPFYTYDGLVAAIHAFPAFAHTGNHVTRAREAAAFLAQADFETDGLRYVKQIDDGNYAKKCDASKPYGCPAGKAAYYGRGPIMLSWNFNYKNAGDALGLDLLHHPSLVATDPAVAWKTALWYWDTQKGPGIMTGHHAMVSGAGFGQTINAVNGSLECHGRNQKSMHARVKHYQRLIHILGVTPGTGETC